jgi:hypothetical protein
MKRLVAYVAYLVFLGWLAWLVVMPAHAGTAVWFMTGWGPQVWSPGVFQMADTATHIPGVTYVRVYAWNQTQQIANEIQAHPHDNIIISGYSCGANSASVIAYAFNGKRKLTIATIQPSVWCGGYPLGSAITYAQETYAGCIITLGFGCKVYDIGPGFTGHFVKIKRPDLHPFADTDPDAQRDVLSVIATVANPQLKRAFAARLVRGRTTEVVRYHGQGL